MKKNKSALFVVFVALLTSATALAESDQSNSSPFPKLTEVTSRSEFRPHVGITMGIVNPDGNYNVVPEYGVDVGFQPYIPFGAGLEVATSTVSRNSEGKEFQRTILLARGTYNFGGNTPLLQHSYVGLGLGPYFATGGTTLAVAPMLGFDIPLSTKSKDYFSLGFNTKYLVSSSDAPNSLSASGMLKYWF